LKERWKSPKKQRRFFDRFAKSKQFCPLIARNWYSITQRDIVRSGGVSILQYYKGSHVAALMTLYPELILEKGKFCKRGRPKLLF